MAPTKPLPIEGRYLSVGSLKIDYKTIIAYIFVLRIQSEQLPQTHGMGPAVWASDFDIKMRKSRE